MMIGWSALIAGGTGLVGGHLLDHLLTAPDVGKVVAPTRRPLNEAEPRLTEIPADFAALALPSGFKPQVAFSCLGTTISKAGSQAAFRAVDYEAVMAFAKSARAAGVDSFVTISSVGANPLSPSFYLRTKGETERDLATLGFKALHILRPSFLLGDREEFRPGEAIGSLAARLLSPLLWGPFARLRAIDADTVAVAMLDAARSEETGVHIHEYSAIRNLADL